MKMDSITFFDTQTLESLPVYYRFLKKLETSKIDELYTGARFSTSVKHNSSNYISYSLYKPVSNIIFNDLYDDLVTDKMGKK